MTEPIICLRCEESIAAGDELCRHAMATMEGPRILHLECDVRGVVGGLNHLKGKCTCCGGTEPPDPPELSRREAAKQAYRYWMGQGVQRKFLRDEMSNAKAPSSDDIVMLRVVDEAGPINAESMATGFIRQVKMGWIGLDGRLTALGLAVLHAGDK